MDSGWFRVFLPGQPAGIPYQGLSPIMVSEVAKIVNEINQTGVTVVLVEQNARMALKPDNNAYVLDVGTIS